MQLRPAREAVRAGDDELGVGELELRGRVRVVLAHPRRACSSPSRARASSVLAWFLRCSRLGSAGSRGTAVSSPSRLRPLLRPRESTERYGCCAQVGFALPADRRRPEVPDARSLLRNSAAVLVLIGTCEPPCWSALVSCRRPAPRRRPAPGRRCSARSTCRRSRPARRAPSAPSTTASTGARSTPSATASGADRSIRAWRQDATLTLRSVGTPWLRSKVFWYVKPSYRGRVLIRGRRFDAPGTLRFGEQRLSRELRIRPGQTVTWDRQPDGSRGLPSAVRALAGRLLRGPDGRHELLAHGGLPGHDGIASATAKSGRGETGRGPSPGRPFAAWNSESSCAV